MMGTLMFGARLLVPWEILAHVDPVPILVKLLKIQKAQFDRKLARCWEKLAPQPRLRFLR